MKAQQVVANEAPDCLAEFYPIDAREDRELRGRLGQRPGTRHGPLPELEASAARMPNGRPPMPVYRPDEQRLGDDARREWRGVDGGRGDERALREDDDRAQGPA